MPKMHPEELIREARRLHADGAKFKAIARRLGVSESSVSRWVGLPGTDLLTRRAKLDGLAERAALRLPLFGEGRR